MNNSLTEEFPKLAQQLEREEELVDMEGTPISLKEMQLIHKYLRNDVTVTILDLTNCEIGDEHCKIISELLKENSTIKALILDFNAIKADGINSLALGLKQNRRVERLSMCGILPKDHAGNNSGNPMQNIGLFLSSPDCWLETLHFENNQMDTEGAKCLGKSLALNENLTELSLSNSRLNETNCFVICEGLKNNSTLTHLDLSYNSIGGKSVANALSSQICALEELDISKNPIEHGINAIFESLIGNTKLKKLRMRHTGAKSGCLTQLGDLFRKNKTMHEYFFEDLLEQDVLELIANTMKGNTTIKKLVLNVGYISQNTLIIIQNTHGFYGNVGITFSCTLQLKMKMWRSKKTQ